MAGNLFIQSKPKPALVKLTAHDHLWLGIPTSYAGHHPRAGLLVYNIYHLREGCPHSLGKQRSLGFSKRGAMAGWYRRNQTAKPSNLGRSFSEALQAMV